MNEQQPPRRRRDWLLGSVVTMLLMTLASVAGAAFFIWSGAYDIGADAPHTKPVFWVISALRDRSIAVHAKAVTLPADLGDPRRVPAGGALYAGLCAGCHLGPGVKRTDLSRGLYPKAPPLAYGDTLTPAQKFWIVKHGIKLTAMPAWGKTHDDDEIWSLVAFAQKLPSMSPADYEAATAPTAQAQSK